MWCHSGGHRCWVQERSEVSHSISWFWLLARMGIGISKYLVIDWLPNYRVIYHPSCFLKRVAHWQTCDALHKIKVGTFSPCLPPCFLVASIWTLNIPRWSKLKRQGFNPRLMGGRNPRKRHRMSRPAINRIVFKCQLNDMTLYNSDYSPHPQPDGIVESAPKNGTTTCMSNWSISIL